jgi:hypothetical protein
VFFSFIRCCRCIYLNKGTQVRFFPGYYERCFESSWIRVTREFISQIAQRICALIIVRTFPNPCPNFEFRRRRKILFLAGLFLRRYGRSSIIIEHTSNIYSNYSNTVSLLFRFLPQGACLEGPPPDGILLC